MSNIRFSQLPTVVALKDNDVLAVSSPNTATPPVYTSVQAPVSQIAAKVVEDTTFTTSLPTTNKTVAGAISEMYGKVFVDTLTAGNTTVTIQDSAITTNSTLDIYTDTFGVNPSDVTVTTGQIVLTFASQSSNVGVKVRVT